MFPRKRGWPGRWLLNHILYLGTLQGKFSDSFSVLRSTPLPCLQGAQPVSVPSGLAGERTTRTPPARLGRKALLLPLLRFPRLQESCRAAQVSFWGAGSWPPSTYRVPHRSLPSIWKSLPFACLAPEALPQTCSQRGARILVSGNQEPSAYMNQEGFVAPLPVLQQRASPRAPVAPSSAFQTRTLQKKVQAGVTGAGFQLETFKRAFTALQQTHPSTQHPLLRPPPRLNESSTLSHALDTVWKSPS